MYAKCEAMPHTHRTFDYMADRNITLLFPSETAMDYYGKLPATTSSDNTIKIIGVSGNSHQPLAMLSGHQGPVWQVAWAHPKCDSMLASCSYDGRVIIWKGGSKPEEWAHAHTFADHKSSVNSIAWAPHELGLGSTCGSSDGNISAFSAPSEGGWDTTRVDQVHPVCERS
jgi:protein transport protein SEC13